VHNLTSRISARGSRERRGRRRHRIVDLCIEQLEDRCLLSGTTSLIDDNPHNFSVMSRNLYLGADLGVVLEVAQTGTQLEISAAVGQLWADVHTRDFPARAVSFVEEVAENQPHLIGLQEVSLFVAGDIYYQNNVQVPGTAETIDYLDILLDQLDAQGLHYTTVATTNEFGGVFTALVDPDQFAFQDIHYMDRDVILARTDLPEPAMMLSNVQSGNFETNVPLNLGGMELPILRGWNSVDVQVWGQDFRLVNTHLEDDNPDYPGFGLVQMAQAVKLVSLYRGDMQARAMDRVMEPVTPDDPETGPLWPSDHAGVAATIGLRITTDGWETPWAVLSDDPRHPGEQALFIVGTDRPEGILVDRLWDGGFTVRMPRLPRSELIHGAFGGQIYVHAGAGNDLVYLSRRVSHDAMIFAGDGDDLVWSGEGNDEIFGGAGSDWLFGLGGDDWLCGDEGCDLLFGGTGNDHLFGAADDDWLCGGSGDDELDGGEGYDWLFGNAGRDSLTGGEREFA
jgi:hypothetical protein